MSTFLGYEMEPGLVPLVVGVVSTPEGLDKVASFSSWPCDVVEIRLDLIGDDLSDWPVAALRLTKAGIGTLLTIRHGREGGRWTKDEAQRLDCYVQGLPHVNGLDVELDAAILPDIVAAAKGKVTLVGSSHHFRGMPSADELNQLVERGIEAGVDVVKIAAFAATRPEVQRLADLLETYRGRQSLCTLAMGPMGPSSRVELAVAGSCLTYGYLDKPNAVGQPSSEEVRTLLMEKHEEYRIFAEVRSGI